MEINLKLLSPTDSFYIFKYW